MKVDSRNSRSAGSTPSRYQRKRHPTKLNSGFLVRAAAALELAGQQLADAGTRRDQAALAELAAPHDDQLPTGVHVTYVQTAGLTGS